MNMFHSIFIGQLSKKKKKQNPKIVKKYSNYNFIVYENIFRNSLFLHMGTACFKRFGDKNNLNTDPIDKIWANKIDPIWSDKGFKNNKKRIAIINLHVFICSIVAIFEIKY